MIMTVTINPAMDYVLQAPGFTLGETNRATAAHLRVGGKGINVSLVLAALGVDSTATGFLAGAMGGLVETALQGEGIKTDFVWLPEGNTRINVKLKTGVETEINAPGPAISGEALGALADKLNTLTEGDTVVLAGNLPALVPQDTYARLLASLEGRGVRAVVDTTGEALLATLPYHPYLIKPNRRELEQLAGKPLPTVEAVTEAARHLQQAGATNVLVSLGGDGALLLDAAGDTYYRPAVGGKPVDTVGAGDSMVAGFLAGADRGNDYALALGLAAGGATACGEGLATGDAIYQLMQM